MTFEGLAVPRADCKLSGMTTRETLVKELEQLNISIDFNSKQGLKLLSEYANAGTVVANKEMIYLKMTTQGSYAGATPSLGPKKLFKN